MELLDVLWWTGVCIVRYQEADGIHLDWLAWWVVLFFSSSSSCSCCCSVLSLCLGSHAWTLAEESTRQEQQYGREVYATYTRTDYYICFHLFQSPSLSLSCPPLSTTSNPSSTDCLLVLGCELLRHTIMHSAMHAVSLHLDTTTTHTHSLDQMNATLL